MKMTVGSCTRLLKTSLLLFVALMTLSCATAAGPDRRAKKLLKQSVDLFNGDIRWQDYETAKKFIPQTQGNSFWAQMDRMKRDIRLTDYEIRDIAFCENGLSATAKVHYQYWSVESPILRNATITQKWRFNERKKIWQVIEPGFKAIRKNSSDVELRR